MGCYNWASIKLLNQPMRWWFPRMNFATFHWASNVCGCQLRWWHKEKSHWPQNYVAYGIPFHVHWLIERKTLTVRNLSIFTEHSLSVFFFSFSVVSIENQVNHLFNLICILIGLCVDSLYSDSCRWQMFLSLLRLIRIILSIWIDQQTCLLIQSHLVKGRF